MGKGAEMLEKYKKTGKPISPQMQKMADALDAMDAGTDGQVTDRLSDTKSASHCALSFADSNNADPQ